MVHLFYAIAAGFVARTAWFEEKAGNFEAVIRLYCVSICLGLGLGFEAKTYASAGGPEAIFWLSIFWYLWAISAMCLMCRASYLLYWLDIRAGRHR